MVLKAATSKGTPSTGAMQQAITVLESRVNGTGNSGAQVQQQGSDLINVTVPGKPAQSVIDLVSSTAKLSFRAVLLEQPYTGTSAPRRPRRARPAEARRDASPTATPSSSASPKASTSASPKASTAALSAKLAEPERQPVRDPEGERVREGDRDPHGQRHAEPELHRLDVHRDGTSATRARSTPPP